MSNTTTPTDFLCSTDPTKAKNSNVNNIDADKAAEKRINVVILFFN